jgi:hypothetical protein
MASLLYPFALFLHIVGAFGLIAAVTLEAIGLRGLRRATQAEEARLWLGISRRLVIRLAPASLGTILLTGLYMTAVAWGPKGWILAAFASLIVLAVVGAFGTGLRMARLEPALSGVQDELSDDVRRRLQDPVLLTSLRVRLAIVLGVAFLMTIKPALITAILVIVLAAAIGWLTAQVPTRRTGHELRNEVS